MLEMTNQGMAINMASLTRVVAKLTKIVQTNAGQTDDAERTQEIIDNMPKEGEFDWLAFLNSGRPV